MAVMQTVYLILTDSLGPCLPHLPYYYCKHHHCQTPDLVQFFLLCSIMCKVILTKSKSQQMPNLLFLTEGTKTEIRNFTKIKTNFISCYFLLKAPKILYSLTSLSLKFHKDWSIGCGVINKTKLTFVQSFIFYVFRIFFQHPYDRTGADYKQKGGLECLLVCIR